MKNFLPIKTAFVIVLLCEIFFLHASLFGQSITAQPNDIKFERLNSENGLSYNKVQCILQDKHGYLWFGTVNGLNRYDGYTFKVYENVSGDSSSLAGNDIVSLYQDKEETMWIGGLISSFTAYNPHTEKFTNYFLPNVKTEIHDFLEDENGLLWMASGVGLFSFDKKKGKVQFHATDDSARENIHGVLQDADKDILWLSSETGIRKFNKKTGNSKTYNIPYPAFADISKEITHNIIRDKNGDLWMSTTSQGVYQFNSQTEKLTRHAIDFVNQSAAASKAVTEIMQDANGRILLCGDGLAFYDMTNQSFTFYKTDFDNAEGIPGKIRTVLKDRNDIYWLGTERGIAKYDPKLNSFTTIKPNHPYTLPSANTIIEDGDHTFWVGNYIGLCSVDAGTGIYTNENALLGSNTYLYSSASDSKGNLWFGASANIFYLKKISGGKSQFISEKISVPVSAGTQITALAFDAAGMLWIGTDKSGLIKYDPASKKFKTYTGDAADPNIFSAASIKALHVLGNQKLLIGARNKGLILMNTETESFQKIQVNKNKSNAGADYYIINAICRDRKNNIWIGTENAGLYQTDTSLASFTNYTIKDGLQSMNISQIVEDDAG
ncbi:MAG TPA: two-component regulator propeller domain-containing protein [Chitinophagaceae bacterium]|nr:two-component regulator propeller domain-containing protein [Chitinophagaceae bacterium]